MTQFTERLDTPYVMHDDIDTIIKHLQSLKTYKVRKKKQTIEYYNIAASFDIETSSFFIKDDQTITGEEWAKLPEWDRAEWKKRATMYIWMVGFDGFCIIGRTWEQLLDMLAKVSSALDLSNTRRIILFVHNLSFEFQWCKHKFEWSEYFATKPYEPLYAVCDLGFEFRCSYRNTAKKLEKVGKDLVKYPVEKMVGDLDYNLIRHCETPLTDKEIGYCINDIKVVMAYIQEQIEAEGRVDAIPLTKTGYVRRDIKNHCFGSDAPKEEKKLLRWKYNQFMKPLTLDVESYKHIKLATQGGFTHTATLWSREVCKDLYSLDIASSYPAEMLADMYPMSAPKERKVASIEQLEIYCKYYCTIISIEYVNLRPRFIYDAYIPQARAIIDGRSTIDNGKVREADRLITTITDVDYWIIKNWYKYDKVKVHKCYTMIKGYLPKPIIESILKYYQGKTMLKGVKGKEFDYMLLKGMLNSVYGMTLTNIINPEIMLDADMQWDIETLTDEAFAGMIDKYNENKGRFLFYPWGTWVTAYARRNIVAAIFEAGQDYVYSDTDSIKLFDYYAHKEWFDKYNRNITFKIDRTLRFYGLDPELARPKGEQMGVFDIENKRDQDGNIIPYKRFKALGAKRYLYEDDEDLHLTVAGLGKIKGRDYIKASCGDPFEAFDDELYVPAQHTGKLTHTYIEEEQMDVLVDYQDNSFLYSEQSAVHLAPCDFSLSISDTYISLIDSLRQAHFNSLYL